MRADFHLTPLQQSSMMLQHAHAGDGRGDGRGLPRGVWQAVVVGELLQRVARAGPRAVSTVLDLPAARVLPAASGDDRALIWMDASATGVPIAASLRCLAHIFRDCRLRIRGREGGSDFAGYVEEQAAGALLRGLADTDKCVREAALEAVKLGCLSASPEQMSAVLEGQDDSAVSVLEGCMYRGQPALTGRALQAELRATYIRSGGALSVVRGPVPPDAQVGPFIVPAPDSAEGAEGAVCEKWMQDWCRGGVRHRDVAMLSAAARAAEAIADGHIDEVAQGQRHLAQDTLLAALSGAQVCQKSPEKEPCGAQK